MCDIGSPSCTEPAIALVARALDLAGIAPDERHGPLPLLLLVLTAVTGLVDAFSYFQLGQVFVANMTGNVVFLGFAVAGASGFSVFATLTAVGAFLVGALAGGRLATRTAQHRGRFLAIATGYKIVLVGIALAIVAFGPGPTDPASQYTLISLLAASMGLQNATARRLRVPDLTTTVLTLTLTGLAAESRLAGGDGSNESRRIAATLAMLAGAAVGTMLIFSVGPAAVLALVLTLLAFNGVVAARTLQSNAPWTTASV
jgi:uncharacterized membrane protein YoaK (UPF0700 family)